MLHYTDNGEITKYDNSEMRHTHIIHSSLENYVNKKTMTQLSLIVQHVITLSDHAISISREPLSNMGAKYQYSL